MGCWSDAAVVQEITKPMPYCLRWNFMPGYRNQRRNKYPQPESSIPSIPLMRNSAPSVSSTLNPRKAPKMILGSSGIFPTINSPLLKRESSRNTSNTPQRSQPSGAKKFMTERERKEPNAMDDSDFLQLVVDTYYRKVSAALKKNDPKLCFLIPVHGEPWTPLPFSGFRKTHRFNLSQLLPPLDSRTGKNQQMVKTFRQAHFDHEFMPWQPMLVCLRVQVLVSQ